MLPAYAGMILCVIWAPLGIVSAPRVCGDDPVWMKQFRVCGLVLPAYAGMIPVLWVPSGDPECAPRVCGDDPCSGAAPSASALCSPRMRG